MSSATYQQLAREELFLASLEDMAPRKGDGLQQSAGQNGCKTSPRDTQSSPPFKKGKEQLPSCLIPGHYQFHAFQELLAVARAHKDLPQALQTGIGPSNSFQRRLSDHPELHLQKDAVVSREAQRNQSRSFDPVAFAQIPSHYDFRKHPQKENPSIVSPAVPVLPPLRVGAPLNLRKLVSL